MKASGFMTTVQIMSAQNSAPGCSVDNDNIRVWRAIFLHNRRWVSLEFSFYLFFFNWSDDLMIRPVEEKQIERKLQWDLTTFVWKYGTFGHRIEKNMHSNFWSGKILFPKCARLQCIT